MWIVIKVVEGSGESKGIIRSLGGAIGANKGPRES